VANLGPSRKGRKGEKPCGSSYDLTLYEPEGGSGKEKRESEKRKPREEKKKGKRVLGFVW